METDLAPIQEETLPADSWANADLAIEHHYRIPGRITQAELDRMEAEFLARGGCIEEIAAGVSAEVSLFNGRPVGGSSMFLPEERIAHDTKRIARIYDGDAEVVEKLKAALPTAAMQRDLTAACNCSRDKVVRILKTYFADDPLAQPFLKLRYTLHA